MRSLTARTSLGGLRRVTTPRRHQRPWSVQLARKHLCGAPLGDLPLARLRKSHVDELVVRLRRAGLADTTVRLAYTTLRAVLADAVLDGLIADNAAAKTPRPRVARREARHLSAASVVKILAAAEHERYARVLTLIAGTGLRRGEALAMRWDAVSLTAGTLKVAATMNVVDGQIEISEPKSGRSRRSIPLSPAMVSLLKAQRATQAEERLRAGSCGPTAGWSSPTSSGHR